MSVTSVTDHPDSGEATRTPDERTYVRKQIVRTDSRDDGPAVVLAHASVVKYGGIYLYRNEIDVGARCLNLACDPYEGGLIPGGRIFLVTGNFTSKFSEQEKQQEEQNPLAIPPRVMPSGTEEQRKVVSKDKNGDDILNAVGDPFLDPPELPRYLRRLTIVNNEAYLDEEKFEDYYAHVNNATWRGATARKWLITGIHHSEARWQAGIRYYEVTYEFLKNPDTWDLEILNVGSRYNFNSESTLPPLLKNCRDDHADNTDVMRLSTKGARLASTDASVYLTKRCYGEATFSELGIEHAQ